MQFINSPFTLPIESLPFHTEIIEIKKNLKNLPFKATFLPLDHTTTTLGFRFEINNRIITYCTDTGYCKNALRLSKDADILITECSMKTNEVSDDPINLNPGLAAKIAKESDVKNLFLMHFDASRYISVESRVEAEKSAREIFSNSYASYDGLEVEV